jgi:hypothetical protein
MAVSVVGMLQSHKEAYHLKYTLRCLKTQNLSCFVV